MFKGMISLIIFSILSQAAVAGGGGGTPIKCDPPEVLKLYENELEAYKDDGNTRFVVGKVIVESIMQTCGQDPIPGENLRARIELVPVIENYGAYFKKQILNARIYTQTNLSPLRLMTRLNSIHKGFEDIVGFEINQGQPILSYVKNDKSQLLWMSTALDVNLLSGQGKSPQSINEIGCSLKDFYLDIRFLKAQNQDLKKDLGISTNHLGKVLLPSNCQQ